MVRDTVAVFGTHDARTIEQLNRCVSAERGARAVLCADGHVGYSMPIGGVVAYRRFISPSGVGYDIACGNLAAKTDVRAADVSDWGRLATEIQQQISFGIGRRNNDPIDEHPVFDRIAQSPVRAQRGLLQLKGHRSVGGMRASIYNAMPLQGVETLVQFMREFEAQHG